MAITVVDQIALFKVQEGTDPKIQQAFEAELQGLSQLDGVISFAGGRSAEENSAFSHGVYVRHRSKESQQAYLASPQHTHLFHSIMKPNNITVVFLSWESQVDDPVLSFSAFRGALLKLKPAQDASSVACIEKHASSSFSGVGLAMYQAYGGGFDHGYVGLYQNAVLMKICRRHFEEEICGYADQYLVFDFVRSSWSSWLFGFFGLGKKVLVLFSKFFQSSK